MFKVMSVFGTRPEAIKMCPLIKMMEDTAEIDSVVCLTGQHKEMLQQVIDIFQIDVKYNLEIMEEKQTLTSITVNVLKKIEAVYKEEKPDLVLVHGDTSTSFVAALAAYYQHVKVGHVEAGLRTYNKYFPFPEEMNRTLTGHIADLHFAPTELNRKNLERENIFENVYVTGNTVIDAFKTTVTGTYTFKNTTLARICSTGNKNIVITAHRRENIGQPLEHICEAIKKLAKKYTEYNFVYPVHLNPVVQTTVRRILSNIENIYLINPIDVVDMHNLLSRSLLVMTDSGGLQEEAPFFHVPVLVLRAETERSEAVNAGTVKLVGTDCEIIVKTVEMLLEDENEYTKMAIAKNPYGDGMASERIVNSILEWMKKNE